MPRSIKVEKKMDMGDLAANKIAYGTADGIADGIADEITDGDENEIVDGIVECR